MKRLAAVLMAIVGFGCLGSLVFANPALLPKHPGYPASSDTSPVTGQSLANDPGQLSLSMEQSSLEAASSEDAHVAQRFRSLQDNRMTEGPNTGDETKPSMQNRSPAPRSSEAK